MIVIINKKCVHSVDKILHFNISAVIEGLRRAVLCVVRVDSGNFSMMRRMPSHGGDL